MCRAERSNLWFAIQCHYSEVIRIFFSKHLSFPNSILNFFSQLWCHMFRKIHSITFWNYLNHPIKVLQKYVLLRTCKHANILENVSPYSTWMFLGWIYLIRENFLRYKLNILFLVFSHTKESIFHKNIQFGY